MIRAATADDVESLRELRLEALRLNPVQFSADPAEWEAKPLEFWRNLCGPNDAVFVAEDGGRLIGMAGLFRGTTPKNRHRAWIWGVYVRPDFRRRGIAGELLDACIAWGRAQKLALLMIDVVVGNDHALRCYESHGFRTYGVQPMVVQVDGVFYDENLMAMRL